MNGVPLAEAYCIIAATALLMGLVLATSSSRRDGNVSWAAAFFLHASTYLVLLVCPADQAPLGLLLASISCSAGSACMLWGLARLADRPLDSRALWLPLLLILLTAPVIDAWPTARVLCRGLILSSQLALLLWFLVKHRHALPGNGKYWLAFGLGLIVAIHMARVGYAVRNGAEGWPMVSLVGTRPVAISGFRQIAALAAAVLLPMIVGTSSLVIVKDRLGRQAVTTQAFMQKIFDAIPHQFCVIDSSGVIITVNRAWLDFAAANGGDPALIGVGANYLAVTSGHESRIAKGIRDVIEHRLDHFSTDYPCHGPDHRHWFVMRVAPLDGPRGRAVISHTEITGQKELELLRERNLTLFRNIASSVPGILYKVRDQGSGKPAFEFMSPRIADLGLDAEAVVEDAAQFLSRVHPADVQGMVSSVQRCAAARSAWQAEFRLRHRDGTYRWYEGRAICEPEGSDVVWYGHFQDIQASKDAEERIRIMAQQDSLTGLPNRYLFNDRLHQAIAIASREGTKLALLFIDLDHFKPVNDQHGHEMGDLLLRQVADRLRGSLREADTPARIGGDEFIVMLHRIGSESDIKGVAAKIAATLAEPYLINGVFLRISASIGFAVFPDDGNEAAPLMARADHRMYAAKHSAHQAETPAYSRLR
ncbi:MAG: diguanylate cyclase [Telmatospirillum sp.]|nr:diguanylate cyclase [Telmatospirillum sp.]